MELTTTIELDAPASAAWQVLGEEFGTIHTWSSSLSNSHLIGDLGVGAVRVCTGEGFGPFPPGQVRERLLAFDRDGMQFTYEATEGLPWFVRRARNRWRVEPLGSDRCAVTTHATVELAWWVRPVGFLLPRAMKAALNTFLDELRARVESEADPRALAS